MQKRVKSAKVLWLNCLLRTWGERRTFDELIIPCTILHYSELNWIREHAQLFSSPFFREYQFLIQYNKCSSPNYEHFIQLIEFERWFFYRISNDKIVQYSIITLALHGMSKQCETTSMCTPTHQRLSNYTKGSMHGGPHWDLPINPHASIISSNSPLMSISYGCWTYYICS